MKKSLDDHIKEALLKGTQTAPELKEDIWKNIENSLEKEEAQNRIPKEQRKYKPSFLKVASIAIIFALVFFTTTHYGRAAIYQLKVLFEPEKQITENIEGNEEKKEYSLQKGQMGYVIYIDESMYTKEILKNKDKIVPKNKAEYLPEMYMEISQVEDQTPQETAVDLENTLEEEYEEYKSEGMVEKPLKALHLTANTGYNPDDLLIKYYLVDNTEGGTFIIKLQYIREAAEGHGARFYHMLQEFKVVDLEQVEG